MTNHARFIDKEGVWCQLITNGYDGIPRPTLFLDRDGVVVEEVNYLHKPQDCHLIDGASEVIARANNLGWFTVIVTNQAGIARGYYGWEQFAEVQAKMLSDLAGLGAKIDAVYACPHHQDGLGDFKHPNHPARKPNPGMLERAAKALPIELERSWIIGDRASDIGAGRNAGLGHGLQVATGHGSREGEATKAFALSSEQFEVTSIASIKDALTVIPAFRLA